MENDTAASPQELALKTAVAKARMERDAAQERLNEANRALKDWIIDGAEFRVGDVVEAEVQNGTRYTSPWEWRKATIIKVGTFLGKPEYDIAPFRKDGKPGTAKRYARGIRPMSTTPEQ